MGKISLKRVYDEIEESDDKRILVDRLWPRGKKKESLQLTLWAKEVTPSNELRKLFHEGELDFQQFALQYEEELQNNPAFENFTNEVKEWLKEGNVTLLYAAKNTTENHAMVLQDMLHKKINS